MNLPAFSSVRRQSLSDAVYQQLTDKILGGELVPEQALPAERELAEQLGVNRGAVREALKRLQQAGLVAVRQGGHSVVRDYLAHGGLELLPSLLVGRDGRLQVSVVRAVLAMRSALAPEIAAAAARRPEPLLARRLDALLQAMQAAAASLPTLQQLALDYWQELVMGSGNVAFRLAFNSMLRSYRQAWDVLRPAMATEFRDAINLGAIAAAVRRGDAEAARRAARAHVELGRRGLEKSLDALERELRR